MAYGLAAAMLFGLSLPLSKALLGTWDEVLLAGFLYFTSGIGVFAARPFVRAGEPLRRRHLPWLAGAVLLGGVAAPVALLHGLGRATGYAGSLLTNLESVFTAAIAVVIFGERLARREWMALIVLIAGAVVVSWSTAQAQQGSDPVLGAVLIGLAYLCWGFDNNFTRHISTCDPLQIAGTKGLVAGCANLSIGLAMGKSLPMAAGPLALAAFIGLASYGISLIFFVISLRKLGSARTGALFATSVVSGVLGSWIFLHEVPPWSALAGGAAMVAGVVWMALAQKPAGDSRA